MLRENAKFSRGQATVLDTVKWHQGGTQARVGLLKSRLQNHANKLQLSTEPLKIALLQGIGRQIDYTIRRIDILTAGVHTGYVDIPEVLQNRYMQALEIGKPDGFDIGSPPQHEGLLNFPFKEGFDALVHHFNESTKRYSYTRTSDGPSLAQYNNLFKSRWILDKLKKSKQLRAFPFSLKAHSLQAIGEEVLMEYSRLQADVVERLTITGLADGGMRIDQLGDEYFTVWLQGEADVPLVDTDEVFGREEKILEIPLALPGPGYVSSSLFVFRQKEETEFRLVRSSKPDQGNPAVASFSLPLTIHSTSIVPLYAIPGRTPQPLTIQLFVNNTSTPISYQMQTRLNMHELQQALLGCDVVHEVQSTALWRIHRRSLSKPEESGVATVQIWRHKPLKRIASLTTGAASDGHSGTRSTSTANNTIASMFSTDTFNSKISTLVPHRDDPSKENIITVVPSAPTIMFFTQLRESLCYIQLKLYQNMDINERRCDCGSSPQSCKEVVIECCPPNSKKFTIRKLKVPSTKDVRFWNLSAFSVPPTEGFDKLEKDTVTWLTIQFDTVENKAKFQHAFLKMMELYKNELRQYQTNCARLTLRANRPINQSGGVPSTHTLSRTPTMTSPGPTRRSTFASGRQTGPFPTGGQRQYV